MVVGKYNITALTFNTNKSDSLPVDVISAKIKDFLLESSSIYSDIDRWWDTTVLPGIKTGQRTCNYLIQDDDIIALSIGKHSEKSSKLCSFKVLPEFRHQGIGELLLRRTLSELLKLNTKSIHFTVSDEIQEKVGKFFTNHGFHLRSWAKNRYSYGRDELVYVLDYPHSSSLINRHFDSLRPQTSFSECGFNQSRIYEADSFYNPTIGLCPISNLTKTHSFTNQFLSNYECRSPQQRTD
jgi:ribosomal protein S18 acetylase RimI-like enzyme